MFKLTTGEGTNTYVHWSVAAVLVALLFICWWYDRKRTEGFDLDQIKKEIRLGYQISNPNVQYQVNPIPYLLDFLKGRSYYPSTLPRRPTSIINPMREPILRVASVENSGNLPSIYSPPYAGPNLGTYRAYRYPHNDLLYKPWQLSISSPYNDYGSQQGGP